MPSAARDSLNSERGFTLIEVLVALAIAALGLVAIFEAGGAGLRGVDLAGHYVAATREAEARLAQVGIEIPLGEREVGGTDGGLRWLIRMKPELTRAGQDGRRAGVALYAVETVVTWPGAGARAVRLSTFRLGASAPRPAAPP